MASPVMPTRPMRSPCSTRWPLRTKMSRQVHVVSDVAVRVLHLHQIAVATFHPRENHASVANGLHGSAHGRAVIGSEMRAYTFRIGWKRLALKCDVIGAANFRGECRNAFFMDFPSGV